jgi:hypothetical protein
MLSDEDTFILVQSVDFGRDKTAQNTFIMHMLCYGLRHSMPLTPLSVA